MLNMQNVITSVHRLIKLLNFVHANFVNIRAHEILCTVLLHVSVSVKVI